LLKAKVRGIYTTALTKLLIEGGFEIVEPSLAIRERFGLNENKDFPDIKIKDRFDRQGVRVIGVKEAVNRFWELLRLNLDDVITRKWSVSVDGIYKGMVKEKIDNYFLIDIGQATGKLPSSELPNRPENGVVLVQVERKGIGAKNPLLSTKIKIAGKYAILVPSCKVGVSLKIRDIQKRSELYKLGKELAPENWGIIWRNTAAYQPHEVLKMEIKKLTEKAHEIMKKFECAEVPSLILDGLHCMDVEFPALSKRRLDEWRRNVVATIIGHHFYRACGGKVSLALEMAERLLERGSSPEEIESLFKTTIEHEYPVEGSTIHIEHVKLSGKVLSLGHAVIEKLDEKEIRFKRVFRKPGVYDGLETRKEPGDIAITEAKFGEWFFKTSYFSKSGKYKGAYINLNTPVEFYPYRLRYVDLEVDVCVLPDGATKLLDEDKLWEAVEKGFITEKLANFIMKKVSEVINENLSKE
jgi:protein associated with RNAse G/E